MSSSLVDRKQVAGWLMTVAVESLLSVQYMAIA